jgi:N-acetylglutamate synthase-like GNAT family acetyltransferase
MVDVDIRRACPEDFESARTLLLASGLPVEDLSESRMESFLVATSGASMIGLVGLEVSSGVGLLRSLVVAPGSRAAGVGRLLVGEVEAYASCRGIAELWLLTTDADRYFQALGYAARKRNEAPRAIRQTAEFALLCPGDATLMQKTI